MEEFQIYSYFYDGLVVVSIFSSVIYGYRKGFLNGFISLLSCFFSFLVANFFGRFVLQSSVFGFLNFLNLNDVVLNLVGNSPKKKSVFEGFFNSSGNTFSTYLVFWCLIFALSVGFKRLFKKLFFLTNFLKKIPILNELDGLLGGVFGLMEAIIFLVAVAFGCFILIIITKNNLKFLNSEVIDSTKLFFLFYKILSLIKFQNFV